jgi:hypothetical protein
VTTPQTLLQLLMPSICLIGSSVGTCLCSDHSSDWNAPVWCYSVAVLDPMLTWSVLHCCPVAALLRSLQVCCVAVEVLNSSAAAVMASSTILSPRPLELAPAASLSELDQFCSGPLDSFLQEAARFKRSPMHRSGHSPSKAAGHKRSGSGSGKSSKAAAVKKASVSCMRNSLTHCCFLPAFHVSFSSVYLGLSAFDAAKLMACLSSWCCPASPACADSRLSKSQGCWMMEG